MKYDPDLKQATLFHPQTSDDTFPSSSSIYSNSRLPLVTLLHVITLQALHPCPNHDVIMPLLRESEWREPQKCHGYQISNMQMNCKQKSKFELLMANSRARGVTAHDMPGVQFR
jgi:hypothetical protein